MTKKDKQLVKKWLTSIDCKQYYRIFIDQSWNNLTMIQKMPESVINNLVKKSGDQYRIKNNLNKIDAFLLNQNQKNSRNKPEIIKTEKQFPIYLKVTYNDRQDAVAMGCVWDPDVRLWYVVGKNSNASFVQSRFGIARCKVTILNVHFKDNDIVKKLGAQWDNNRNKWISPRSNSDTNHRLLCKQFGRKRKCQTKRH
jgi:hypothetical protein